MDKTISEARYLTEKEVQEIKDYFKFLDVCGECGKWYPIFPSIFYGVCVKDFFKKETRWVEKRKATDLSCDSSIYWNEFIMRIPRCKQTQGLIQKAKDRLSKFGLRWADMVLKKVPDISEDVMWIIIMSKIIQDLDQEDLDLLMNIEEPNSKKSQEPEIAYQCSYDIVGDEYFCLYCGFTIHKSKSEEFFDHKCENRSKKRGL